jgi:hypothetical protein
VQHRAVVSTSFRHTRVESRLRVDLSQRAERTRATSKPRAQRREALLALSKECRSLRQLRNFRRHELLDARFGCARDFFFAGLLPSLYFGCKLA